MRKIASFSLFLTNNRFLEAKRGENGRFSRFRGDLHGGVGETPYYITRAKGDFGDRENAGEWRILRSRMTQD